MRTHPEEHPDLSTSEKLFSFCLKDKYCRNCLAMRNSNFLIKAIFALSIISVIFSPLKRRKMRSYYCRLILIILSGMFAFGGWTLWHIPVILWAPLLMLTRKCWFPMPGDKKAVEPAGD
jgi:hypothetical protein